MLTYCLVCKKNTENKDAKMVKNKNGRLALSSKCVVCGSKKSRFIEEQGVRGLLGKNLLMSKIPLLNNFFLIIWNIK